MTKWKNGVLKVRQSEVMALNKDNELTKEEHIKYEWEVLTDQMVIQETYLMSGENGKQTEKETE